MIQTVGDVSEKDRLVCWRPVANLFQRMLNVCGFIMGAETSILKDPLSIMTELPVLKPTIIIGVPRFYERIFENANKRLENIPHLFRSILKPLISFQIRRALGGQVRMLFTGSAPLSQSVFHFFHSLKLNLIEAYGLSESILPIAINTNSKEHPGSVGRLLPSNEVKLAMDGEILIKGPGMAHGYFKSSDDKRWDDEGYFHTGDLGYFDKNGYLYLEGRKADLIKLSNGRRISPMRIEEELSKVALVDRVIVVGPGRKSLVAIISLKCRPNTLSILELQNLKNELTGVTSKLASYEQVKKFIFLKEGMTIEGGHLTTNLKVKRTAIERMCAHELNELSEANANNIVVDIEKRT
jgi:long-chain acyl-CoA synthetase